MTALSDVRAIVRLELLPRIVQHLDRGVPRLTVLRVHAIGPGVDPATARISLDEGTELAEKAFVQFTYQAVEVDALVDAVVAAARHRVGAPGAHHDQDPHRRLWCRRHSPKKDVP